MRLLLSFLFTLVFSLTTVAQNSIISVYSPEESIQLIINGIVQNKEYDQVVKVQGLTGDMNYKLVVRFQSPSIEPITKSVYLMENGMEYTYEVKKVSIGNFIFKAKSILPVQEVDENTTKFKGDAHSHNPEEDKVKKDVLVDEEPEVDHYVMPGYKGKIGCKWPMDETDFISAKNSIAKKGFEESKLTMAKQVTKANCLTASQVKQFMELFDYEDTKQLYAQFAYDYTYDVDNYYKIHDAFEFDTSVNILIEALKNKTK